MKQQIRVLIINESVHEAKLDPADKSKVLTSYEWIKNNMKDFFSMCFEKGRKNNFFVVSTEGLKNAKSAIGSGGDFDFIVIPAAYQSQLLDLINNQIPETKIVIVCDRELKHDPNAEGSYWLGKILTLIAWTGFLEFERLMKIENVHLDYVRGRGIV